MTILQRQSIAATLGILLIAFHSSGALATGSASNDFEIHQGGIIRGPKSAKRLAMVFTGHTFAEGGQIILDELAKHDAKASFFLTGDFLANTNFAPVVRRIVSEGHYLGPHSDKHLLYCSWDAPAKLLITRNNFAQDLAAKIGRASCRERV